MPGNLRYIRANATGTNDGSDWVNAYTSLPATLQRGYTYYIADGNYSGHLFNDPVSGEEYIALKKAIESDHGTSTGWVSSYGDGQAVFTSSEFYVFGLRSSYYIIDGSVGGGPGNWDSGHGFKIKGTIPDQKLVDGGAHFGVPVSNVLVKHTELEHLGLNTGGGDSGFYLTANSNFNMTNVTISYCYLHDFNAHPIDAVNIRHWVLEYNYITRAYSSNGICIDDLDGDDIGYCKDMFYGETGPRECNYSLAPTENPSCPSTHGTCMQLFGAEDFTIRNNLFEDIQGTAVVDCKTAAVAGDAFSYTNIYIYGNVFYYTPAMTSGVGGNGVIAVLYSFDKSHTSITTKNMKIFNNDFVNIQALNAGIGIDTDVNEGNEVFNNIWYNSAAHQIGFNGVTEKNSNFAYDNWRDGSLNLDSQVCTGDANCEIGTANPFVDADNHDFRIKGSTSPGKSLSVPYDRDMFGNTRGADGVWDRGAVEYVSE